MEVISMPGKDNRDYLAKEVMPTVSAGLNKVLSERPEGPVAALVEHLRANNPNQPRHKFDVTTEFGPLNFTGKSVEMNAERKLPSSFRKVGELPVFFSEIPTKSNLPHIFKYLREEEMHSTIHVVVVSTNDVMMYNGNDAYRATLSGPTMWEVRRSVLAKSNDAGGPAAASGLDATGTASSTVGLLQCETHVIRQVALAKGMTNRPAAHIVSVVDVIRAIDPQAQVHRFEHANDVPITAAFCDEITVACDGAAQGSNGAVLILSCDRERLVEHTACVASIYFRVLREVQMIRRQFNVVDQQILSEIAFDFDGFETQLTADRTRRDQNRRALLQAHIATLVENGKQESTEEVLARDKSDRERFERRARADNARKAAKTDQGSGAAVRVQSFIRGLLARKNRHSRRGSRAPSRTTIDESYQHGRYPLVELSLELSMVEFGPDHITNTIPKRGATRRIRKWSVKKKRIRAKTDMDVSSEDEEWHCEEYDRVGIDISVAFNPFSDVRAVQDEIGMDDMDLLFDLYRNYANIPNLQKKASRLLERFSAYMHFAAFCSFRHKKHEMANAVEHSTASKMLRLPACVSQCDHFGTFVLQHSRPLEIFANSAFVTSAFSNLPQPYVEQRALIAANTSTGQYTKVLGDKLIQPIAPDVPILVAPDILTGDQLTEALAHILKPSMNLAESTTSSIISIGSANKRVLWLHTSPDVTVYINNVPFRMAQRRAKDIDPITPHHPVSVLNADVNEQQFKVSVSAASPDASIRGAISDGDNSVEGSPIIPSPIAAYGSGKYLLGSRRSSMELRTLQKPKAPDHVVTTWYGADISIMEKEAAEELVSMIGSEDAQGMLRYRALERPVPPNVPVTQFSLGLSDVAPTTFVDAKIRVLKRVVQQPLPLEDTRASIATVRIGSRAPSGAATPRASGSFSTSPASVGLQPLPNMLPPVNGVADLSPAASANLSGSGSNFRRPGANRARKPTRAERGQEKAMGSSISHYGAIEDMDDSVPLPTNASEAISTPAQLAENVQSRLRRIHGIDGGFMYRRFPMLHTSGMDWLENFDLIYQHLETTLSDPKAQIAVTIRDEESVLLAVMASIVWSVEFDKNNTLGCAALEAAAAGASDVKSDGAPSIASQSLNAMSARSKRVSMENSQRSPLRTKMSALSSARTSELGSPPSAFFSSEDDDEGDQPPPPPLSPFPCMVRLIDSMNKRYFLEPSVPEVDAILEQVNGRVVLYDVIEEHMIAATAASTSGNRTAAEDHARLAVCALERYVWLVLFHGFLRRVEEQREMMSNMVGQQQFSFRLFVETHKEVIFPFLEELNPWEGRDDFERPDILQPSSGMLAWQQRWQRRQVFPNVQ